MKFFPALEWCMLLKQLSQTSRAGFPCVVHAVWWGRHHRRRVAVMGGSGGGAGRRPPSLLPLSARTQTSRLISPYLASKEIYASTRSHNPTSPLWKHTLQPSFPFEITLPVSSFSAEGCSAADETEWMMQRRSEARKQPRLSSVSAVGRNPPVWMGGSVPLPIVTRVPPRIFERLMWRPWNQTRCKTGSRSS